MTASDLPALLGLRRNFTIRLACDQDLFGRRFGLNVSSDERSWIGKRLEMLRSQREPYLGQIEDSHFWMECRPSPLGNPLGRIQAQGDARQVGGLTVLEGKLDGFRTWKAWMTANVVVVVLVCAVLAATAATWPNKALVLMAFVPGVLAYLAITAILLWVLLARETERLRLELEKDLKDWIR